MSEMVFPDFIDDLAEEVKGENNSKDMVAFTLSTCQWCKKFKRYMNDRGIQYRYVDVDQIEPSKKTQILNFLRENFDSRISYPFLICDGKAIVGYSPNKYEELLEE
ncbi:MAG: glutaredoxin family protein [Candidatus Lokiarchaeota archaeon]|nr:glutaredoxin family protein [Candidatus Lokiarchaeota archaeon]MBD3198843.1 glutaredoxin family protein [Candidatus Lokiarchaeota archaeon]